MASHSYRRNQHSHKRNERSHRHKSSHHHRHHHHHHHHHKKKRRRQHHDHHRQDKSENDAPVEIDERTLRQVLHSMDAEVLSLVSSSDGEFSSYEDNSQVSVEGKNGAVTGVTEDRACDSSSLTVTTHEIGYSRLIIASARDTLRQDSSGEESVEEASCLDQPQQEEKDITISITTASLPGEEPDSSTDITHSRLNWSTLYQKANSGCAVTASPSGTDSEFSSDSDHEEDAPIRHLPKFPHDDSSHSGSPSSVTNRCSRDFQKRSRSRSRSQSQEKHEQGHKEYSRRQSRTRDRNSSLKTYSRRRNKYHSRDRNQYSRDRSLSHNRDRDRYHSWDRDRHHSTDRDRYRSRDRHHSTDRDRYRRRDRDRYHSRDKDQYHGRDRGRYCSRDRDRYRDRDHDRSRDRNHSHRKEWNRFCRRDKNQSHRSTRNSSSTSRSRSCSRDKSQLYRRRRDTSYSRSKGRNGRSYSCEHTDSTDSSDSTSSDRSHTRTEDPHDSKSSPNKQLVHAAAPTSADVKQEKIAQLTEFCRQLADKKEGETTVDLPVVHPFAVCQQPSLLYQNNSWKTPSQMVLESNVASVTNKEVTELYPCSSGVEHQRQDQDVTGTISEPLPVSQLVTQRLEAQNQFFVNPLDPQARAAFEHAENQMSQWCKSQLKPGQFTGQSGLTPLTKAEHMQGIQAWARKNMFHGLAPVMSGFGLRMLKRMGWNEGSPLGRTGSGRVEPIELSVKVDRQGLSTQEDCQAPIIPAAVLQASKKIVPACLQGKHPVSALQELCTRKHWDPPLYELVSSSGKSHKMTFLYQVAIPAGTFRPSCGSNSKKLAKAQAAIACLTSLGLMTS